MVKFMMYKFALKCVKGRKNDEKHRHKDKKRQPLVKRLP